MQNLGKASISVKILDGLPGIDTNPKRYSFDVTATNYSTFQNSKFFPPVLAKHISTGEGWGAIFPEPYRYYMNNYVNTGEDKTDPYSPSVLWTPTLSFNGSFFNTITENLNKDLILPPDYPDEYIGPKWADMVDQENAQTDWKAYVQWFAKTMRGGGTPTTPPPSPSGEKFGLFYAHQQTVLDGLFWGVESNPILNNDTPFWVRIKRLQAPSSATSNFIVISLGGSEASSAFDLVLRNDAKPELVDYIGGRNNDNLFNVFTLPIDGSKVFDYENYIDVGFMTVAGRLVIFLNKSVSVYARNSTSNESSDNGFPDGVHIPIKIPSGTVKIYGSNIQVAINLCYMNFAPACALPLPEIGNYEWENATAEGEMGGTSVSVISSPAKPKEYIYGVDCKTFIGPGGTVSPKGEGFHSQGSILYVSNED